MTFLLTAVLYMMAPISVDSIPADECGLFRRFPLLFLYHGPNNTDVLSPSLGFLSRLSTPRIDISLPTRNDILYHVLNDYLFYNQPLFHPIPYSMGKSLFF